MNDIEMLLSLSDALGLKSLLPVILLAVMLKLYILKDLAPKYWGYKQREQEFQNVITIGICELIALHDEESAVKFRALLDYSLQTMKKEG